MYRDDRLELRIKTAIGCLVNDKEILSANLMSSPAVQSGRLAVHVEENARSAASGYNRILQAADAPIVVLAHQDVFLPEGWDRLLAERIAEVEAIDPNWGVITAFGIKQDGTGWGPVWSTSLGRIIGRVAMEPVPIQSADELLIVLRRSDGLLFDEGLSHFHFYGLDIVQTALALGHGAWSVALPCIHNDDFKGSLDENYERCFHYVRRKWRTDLPLRSSTVKIAWHGLHLHRVKWRMRKSFEYRKTMAAKVRADPGRIAERCGWATV